VGFVVETNRSASPDSDVIAIVSATGSVSAKEK
jgi:hypothetical protein